MTVRAQENALRRLLSGGGERAGEPAVRDPERLRIGIEVMELKGCQAAVIAAERAASAALLDKHPLEAPGFAGDRL